MDLSFNEEQEMLRDSARKFLTNECSYEFVDRMWKDENGFTQNMWNTMVELGWLALRIPEEYEGLGLGFVELSILFEEMGRVALPGPFFSTVLATEILVDAGSAEQKETYLPKIAGGGMKATLAVGEVNFRDLASDVRFSASRDGDEFILNGTKLFVLDAHVSDLMILAARTRQTENSEQGISLLLIDRDVPGVSTQLLKTLDGGRKQCRVDFDRVQIPASKILGPVDQGWPLIKNIYKKAAVLLSMEAVGGGQKLLDMAVDYAKIRVQFNQPIGSYQAIKHKCATMMQEVEGARSIAYYAAWAVDQAESNEADIAASTSKIYCCDMYRKAANETIQILGAIGFTWEHELHVFMKRAKMNEFLFGSPSFHREALAVLLDY